MQFRQGPAPGLRPRARWVYRPPELMKEPRSQTETLPRTDNCLQVVLRAA